MSTVKDTPAYWWHMLSDVFAMVKQRDIPTYFMIVLIIEKLKGSGGESVIAGRDYDSRFKELNSILFYLLTISSTVEKTFLKGL